MRQATCVFIVAAVSALPLCATAASEPVAAPVQQGREQPIASITGIPAAVLSALQELCSHCEFADIGARWNPTDVLSDLPRRRVLSVTVRDSVWTIIYQRGGIAMTHHTAVFALTPTVHLVAGSSCLPAAAPCSW